MESKTKSLARFHQRIAEKSRDNTAPSVLIVALGDSVTAGSAAEGVYLHQDVYHAQLKVLLERQYPQCVFSVINAGENGQSATGGIANLERDVLHHQPDLILIAYGLNDAVGEREGLPQYAIALETLIRRTREATQADLILLTPNMMPHYESSNIPDQWRHVTEKFIHLQKDGVLAAYANRMREVGQEHNVAIADIYAAWEELEARGVDTTAMLANGLNHPDAVGHRLAAEVIFQVIVNGATSQ
jgi:lysophospholipase L1-like esterase